MADQTVLQFETLLGYNLRTRNFLYIFTRILCWKKGYHLRAFIMVDPKERVNTAYLKTSQTSGEIFYG